MTSCSVVEDTGLFTRGSAFGDSSKSRKTEVATDSKKAPISEREKLDRELKKAGADKKAAAEAKLVALKNKELEAEKRKLAAKEKSDAILKAKEEEEKATRGAAEKAEKEKASLARLQERENAKLAKAEARRKAEEARASRELEELDSGGGGGYFSRLAMGTPSQYKSKGHDVYVNQRVLRNLEPANGETVPSSGSSASRPAGGVQFVGAEMPYWMRINGGIGMHIGYVPDYPASHGCIRVPETIQPLIFAKVGLGTEVTILQ